MRGLKSEDLVAIIDLVYFGEAKIVPENLDSFLALAEELRLKGLTGTGNSDKRKEQPIETNPNHERQNQVKTENHSSVNFDTAVAVQNKSVNVELEDLDQQIKSIMEMNITRSIDGRTMAICNICGKETASRAMSQHIESNHITGFSHPCNICGNISRSRHALAKHKNTYHKK